MPRDCRVYLDDILQAIEKIGRYTAGLSCEALAGDERTLDAVVRNLEVIGEAVKHLPDEIRTAHPEVDWRRIAGLRDVLIHAYFGVDVEIVWDVIQEKLSVLGAEVKRILAE